LLPYVMAEHSANIYNESKKGIKIYNNSLNRIRILKQGLPEKHIIVPFHPNFGAEKKIKINQVNDTTLTIAPDSTTGFYRLYFTTQKLYDEDPFSFAKQSTAFLNIEIIEPPLAKVKLIDPISGLLYDTKGKISIKNLKYVQVVAKSEEEYELLCPQDSKYAVTLTRVYLIRNGKAIAQSTYTGQVINLIPFKEKSLHGDQLFIEIGETGRLTYKGSIFRGRPFEVRVFQLEITP
jgi:hypothetical protein